MKEFLLRLKGIRRAWIMVMLLSLQASTIVAQENILTIKGKVKDEAGGAVQGVTVRAGKSVVPTDDAGNFTIKTTIGTALSFSGTGYETQTVTVKSDEPLHWLLLKLHLTKW